MIAVHRQTSLARGRAGYKSPGVLYCIGLVQFNAIQFNSIQFTPISHNLVNIEMGKKMKRKFPFNSNLNFLIFQ